MSRSFRFVKKVGGLAHLASRRVYTGQGRVQVVMSIDLSDYQSIVSRAGLHPWSRVHVRSIGTGGMEGKQNTANENLTHDKGDMRFLRSVLTYFGTSY